MKKIVVDCFGGDRSPAAQVAGAVQASQAIDDVFLILSGDETQIKAELDKISSADLGRFEILHAPDVVSPGDKPTDAIRMKKDSSLMKAVSLLRDDDTVAGMVSCGSSGAVVASGTLRIGRLRGVQRPAFCPILPTMTGGVVGVCDSGANVSCTAEYLQQFAVMGSLYLKNVYGIESPRVALLNVGVEAEKGDDLHKEAYALLSETEDLNFCGNMESRDFLSGQFDLVVSDGFSGNVLIKSTEGTALELLKKIKKDIYSRFVYKMGALLMKKMFMEEKSFMDYQKYGGSVLLGTKKIIIKGHGSSKDLAVAKCIEQAVRMEKSCLNEQTEEWICRLPSAKC
ncbi:MAG: phosphate acyltransferase PlsX [Clostridia bacterium]|nr:phosphate acyltransferase PlsX [Clostridia bacterium]